MSENLITINNSSFNLDNLFSFNHSFDNLKSLLQELVSQNQLSEKRINNLEQNLNQKNIIINELDSNIHIITNGFNKKIDRLEKMINVLKASTEGSRAENESKIASLTNEMMKEQQAVTVSKRDSFASVVKLKHGSDIVSVDEAKKNEVNNNNNVNVLDVKDDDDEAKRRKTNLSAAIKQSEPIATSSDEGSKKKSIVLIENNENNNKVNNFTIEQVISEDGGNRKEKSNKNKLSVHFTEEDQDQDEESKDVQFTSNKNNKNNIDDARDFKRRVTELNLSLTQTPQAKDYEEIIGSIMSRLSKLESGLNETRPFKSQINDLYNNIKQLVPIKEDIEKNTLDIDNFKTKTKDWESNLEMLNIKINDFNIYELLKGGGENGEGVNATIVLIENLEKKIFKKFDFEDEKIKKLEENLSKLKGELLNQKNSLDKNFNENSENLENLSRKLGDVESQIKERAISFTNLAKENYENLYNYINNKVAEINDTLNQKDILAKMSDESDKNNELNQMLINTGGFTDEDRKLLKELARRTIENEKIIKIISSSTNVDQIKKDLGRLIEAINKKANLDDLLDIKDALANVKSQTVFLKDSLSQLNEDRKALDDISWLRRKVETLSSSMLNLKNNTDEMSNSVSFKMAPNFDSHKYLENSLFNEFQKSYNREMDWIRRTNDELKRSIEDLEDAMKLKASSKDLTNAEESLKQKIEELRVNCSKKFADKAETQKTLKYLDVQVKHIVDVYIKKMEKGENWLLAKKPIGGYKCASCESYIGDLTENMQQVNWNKYPVRDPTEKSYRIGNGFSRMLQMLNFDHTKHRNNSSGGDMSLQNIDIGGTNININHSQEDASIHRKELILPALNQNNTGSHINPNSSTIDNGAQSDSDGVVYDNNPYRPKVTKIYKKVQKNTSTTTNNNNNNNI